MAVAKQAGFLCEIVFVTPYITLSQQRKIDELLKNKIYDFSVYPPIEKTPYRFAINKRNEWMIDNSDLIISYVKYNHGGAYNAIRHARKKKKRIINLADNIFE